VTAYRRLARPLLFRADAERAHELALRALSRSGTALDRLAGRLRVEDARLAQRVMGLDFPNPVGLAAGFDKYGRAVPAWAGLGFGFCEIGTVTAMPQPGNPQPRLFRLPDDEALVNRLGFNNDGAERTARRLARWDRQGRLRRIPLGVNIGKSRAAPLTAAAEDYRSAYERLWPFADYVVVNVSSPNTPGLRELQDREPLERILRGLSGLGHERPLLVKVSPDLGPEAVDQVVDLAAELDLAGLVVANTSTAREGLRSPHELVSQAGGLSGRPVRDRSTAMVRRVARRSGGALPVIGVGGVFSAHDAWEKVLAGASLVQVYTGLVYEGPTLARRINLGLLELMAREGVTRLSEAVGQGVGAAAW
jgi:dihydroorotate dehydrogenase